MRATHLGIRIMLLAAALAGCELPDGAWETPPEVAGPDAGAPTELEPAPCTRPDLDKAWPCDADPTWVPLAATDDEACSFGTIREDFYAGLGPCVFDAATSAGTSLLTKLGLSLARAGLEQISPGIASLLLGSDPFAEGVERILDRIGAAEQNIIASQVSLVEDEVGQVSIPTIRAILADLAQLDLTGKYGRFLGGEYSNMHLELTEVQQALQNRYDVFGLRSLHVLTTVVSWAVLFEPEMQVLTEIAGRGVPPHALTDAERLAIHEKASAETLEGLTGVLEGPFGYLTYVRGLAAPNRFRQESQARFSGLHACQYLLDELHRIVGQQCSYDLGQIPDATRPADEEDTTTFLLRVERPSQYATEVEVIHAIADSSTCTITPDDRVYCPGRTLASKTVALDGSPDWMAILEGEYERLRQQDYERLVASGYAPLRPTIDAWYRLIGRTPIQTELDDDLDAMMVDGGRINLQVLDSQYVRGQRPRTTLETRSLVNYSLLHGPPDLQIVVWSAITTLWGATYDDIMRFLDTREPPDTAAQHFRGVLTAQLTAAL